MIKRFRDIGKEVHDFGHTYIVKCPECSKRALVVSVDFEKNNFTTNWKFICSNCGRFEEKTSSLELWLSAKCCGKELWFYNEEHLNYIYEFVNADLRENFPLVNVGWRNSSMVSRLPKWMKESNNREELIKCMDSLRETLK
jgi:hypothetical protein